MGGIVCEATEDVAEGEEVSNSRDGWNGLRYNENPYVCLAGYLTVVCLRSYLTCFYIMLLIHIIMQATTLVLPYTLNCELDCTLRSAFCRLINGHGHMHLPWLTDETTPRTGTDRRMEGGGAGGLGRVMLRQTCAVTRRNGNASWYGQHRNVGSHRVRQLQRRLQSRHWHFVIELVGAPMTLPSKNQTQAQANRLGYGFV